MAESASAALVLTRRQHASGYLDRLALISDKQNERQAQLAQIQARALRLLDTAALFQALGGGWWNRPIVAVAGAASPTGEAMRQQP